jgi:hypothetical protein
MYGNSTHRKPSAPGAKKMAPQSGPARGTMGTSGGMKPARGTMGRGKGAGMGAKGVMGTDC